MSRANKDNKAGEPRTNFNIAVRKRNTYDLLVDLIDISVIKDTDINKFVDGIAKECGDIGIAWQELYPQFKEQFENERPRIFKKDIEKGLGCSESTVTRFNRAAPAKRSNLIGLCIMYKQGFENTRDIIKRCEFRDFSPADLGDCIYTYIICNNNEHRTPKATFVRIKNILESKIAEAEASEKLIESDKYILPDGKVVCRNRAFRVPLVEVERLGAELKASLDSFDSFCDFVVRNRAYLGREDDRIVRRMKKMVSKAENPNTDASQSFANSLFKNESFREKFYRVIEGRVPVTRDFIILLCLHLGMGREDIDKILQKSGYSILFRKDLLDLIIIYITEWLYVKAPRIFTDDLSEYYETVAVEEETPEQKEKREMEAKIIYDKVMAQGYTNYINEKMERILSMDTIVNTYGGDDVMKDIETFRSLLVTEE